MVRVDEAGASHNLVNHLLALSSQRKTVLFTCGWMITAADEDATWQVSTGWVIAANIAADWPHGRASSAATTARSCGTPTRAGNNQ
jgi:hypothetical protein